MGNPYLGIASQTFSVKQLLFRKNPYEEVHFLAKVARKNYAALLKMSSFIVCL